MVRKKSEKYLYVYKTTCLINGKVYIGQHNGGLYDNYLGSGRAISKAMELYGRLNFTKEVLKICQTREQADIFECVYIAKYKSRDVRYGYNILKGGFLKSKSKLKFLEDRYRNSPFSNYKQYYEHLKKTGYKSEDCIGEKNIFYNRKHTEESKELISIASLKRSKEISSQMKEQWKKPEFIEIMKNVRRTKTKPVIRIDIIEKTFSLYVSVLQSCDGNGSFSSNVLRYLNGFRGHISKFYGRYDFKFLTKESVKELVDAGFKHTRRVLHQRS